MANRRTMLQRIFTYFVFFACYYVSDCYPRGLGDQDNQKQNSRNVKERELNVGTVIPDFAVVHGSTSHLQPFEITFSAEQAVPESYKLIVKIQPNPELPDGDVAEIVSGAVAHLLNLPKDSVRVSKYEKSTGTLKLYFFSPVKEYTSSFGLVPASEVMPGLSLKKLQAETDKLEIRTFFLGGRSSDDHEGVFTDLFSGESLTTWQLAVVISFCLFALLCVFTIIVYLSSKKWPKDVPGGIEERQVVLQPIMKPDMSDVNIIQPENKDCYVAETDSEHTPSPCRSPLRMKGKGLLERRGSNASLTLDLNRSQENIHCGTPPKECSTEEYLLSASHRLSRKQLQNSLKDVKSIHAEFWEIPMNHPEKVEVAGSGTKNRYKTILPNEGTRVHLQCSDADPVAGYINANYVRGYANEKNAYIATQGPMAHTVNDFWAMVWEQNCPIIVMITKLKEKLKVKCEPYIPDYQGHYKGIDVTVLRIIPRDGYTIRELLLSDGNYSRCVYHFWYTAWPDHKTPDTAKPLLAMAVEVEKLRHNSTGNIEGPTIVHCSAGIGRTGCFIAISIGMQQLLNENVVDILGVICGLRLDRGGMVQTAEQYEFVHQALSVFELTMSGSSGE